ncbi:hypothetical protein RR48_01124 [Papilio machaon]|uniref:Uncharacterized protein n=1 Tax=Papilio machaon TaxID=76193 RepID=A0A0N1IKX4_PAPMA|nr:hypothetical protein RR48_01124 [Papilio machaon]
MNKVQHARVSTSIRDVSDRLPVPRAVADLHDPLGAAGAPLAPAVAGEAEREERKHFETFKRELFARYRTDPLHLLRRPPQRKA